MASINGGSDPCELLESLSHVWNHSFNFINSMSLKCAAELGIPDIIHQHGQPMKLSNLISALPIHSTKSQYVSRLMALLVRSGFFQVHNNEANDDEQAYSLTPASSLHVKDNPFSATPFLSIDLDREFIKPWLDLRSWFQSANSTALKTTFGEELYQKSEHETRLDRLVNECTSSDSKLFSRVVLSKCREVIEGLKSLLDVGGGTGTMARAIAEAFPDIHCTVLDQPHVVAGLQGKENLKYVGGNMFGYIPPADANIIKWVLIDWNDEKCIKLLKKCKESITSGGRRGKLIIIEMVMEHTNWNDKDYIETQLLFDLEAMAYVDRKQRTETVWAKLFFAAGFSSCKISPVLGLSSLIEVFP